MGDFMNWVFNIPLILVLLVMLSGAIVLVDWGWLARRRPVDEAIPAVVEYARSFFPVLLAILLVRSFLVQPYRVPTGSLEPTILPGDFILVNQFAYGLRLPVLNTRFVRIGNPQRGDIVLFRFPEDPTVLFVKRVVGVPGDHVVYRNKQLTINDQPVWQLSAGEDLEVGGKAVRDLVQVKIERLGEVIHKIFVKPGYREWESLDIVVPPHAYFVMGDNRDNSNDSRAWGCVPEANLVGKAFGVWMSWDSRNWRVRWNRIGTRIR